MTAIEIRPERPADVAAIRRVNEHAFGQPAEADIVDALRAAGAVTRSLVAEQGGEVVGHISFSPVTIDGIDAGVGLAPMAVAPGHQHRGIGGMLVRAGLAEIRRAGHALVVVLGHPTYYPRFGFVRASTRGLRWEHEAPDEAFMVLELRAGGVPAAGGVVRYRPELSSA